MGRWTSGRTGGWAGEWVDKQLGQAGGWTGTHAGRRTGGWVHELTGRRSQCGVYGRLLHIRTSECVFAHLMHTTCVSCTPFFLQCRQAGGWAGGWVDRQLGGCVS